MVTKANGILVNLFLLSLVILASSCASYEPANREGYLVYSKHGLSFEFPHSAFITEQGFLSPFANDTSGLVTVVSESGMEVIAVLWLQFAGSGLFADFDRADLKLALEDTWRSLKIVEQSEIKETVTRSGHLMLYQQALVIENQTEMNSICAVWYCDINRRFYVVSAFQEPHVQESTIITVSRKAPASILDFSNHFNCH